MNDTEKELLTACESLVQMFDGLPWHVRYAVITAYNERTGSLPGSTPKPISDARAIRDRLAEQKRQYRGEMPDEETIEAAWDKRASESL